MFVRLQRKIERNKKFFKLFGYLKTSIIFVLIMAYEIISNEHLTEISNKLAQLYPHWLELVAEYISKEKDWKNYSNVPCSKENARHISMGTIKSQFHRRLFMKCGAKMLVDAAQESKEITDLLEQAK